MLALRRALIAFGGLLVLSGDQLEKGCGFAIVLGGLLWFEKMFGVLGKWGCCDLNAVFLDVTDIKMFNLCLRVGILNLPAPVTLTISSNLAYLTLNVHFCQSLLNFVIYFFLILALKVQIDGLITKIQ